MTESRVWHIADPTCPRDAVYIGRGTPYGNPFFIGWDGTRDEVISKYRDLILGDPQMVDFVQRTLAGKHLMCHCFPQACHGDVLLTIANPPF